MCFSIKKNLIIVLIFCFALFCYCQNKAFSQSLGSSDAIAIRVVPNSEHLSALAWFKQQGFEGAPQSLKVDSYNAIRDGRTVYVNAANIGAGVLYTNIYIISYTQEAEISTVDIFSRIIKNWKFNNNLSNMNGHCRENQEISCLKDSDCSIGDFCDTVKARLVRDTRRLEDFAFIELAFLKYFESNGFYPKLASGSYLPNKTISVWPSWQETLASDLEIDMPVDPINKLGFCSADRFNENTCWDEETKEFDDRNLSNQAIDLPPNSLVYTYKAAEDAQSYDFCGVLESGFSLLSGYCSGTGVCLIGS